MTRGDAAWIGSTESGRDLWSPHHDKRGKPRKGPGSVDGTEVLPDAVVSRVATLLKDGALRRACAALLQEPPISPTGDVVTALRGLHPAPGDGDRAGMQSLRHVASRAAPVADVDGVRKAVQSFPSSSGALKSGLRPSHIRDATRPASSDLLFRLITEVVNLFLQGEVPESVRPFVCGASIMALRKPNGTLRPIAVGETIRRITGKVAVELISERARALLEPARPLFTPLGNGSTGIARFLQRRQSQWTSPTPSTLWIGWPSCVQSALTFHPLHPGWTAATVTTVTCLRVQLRQ